MCNTCLPMPHEPNDISVRSGSPTLTDERIASLNDRIVTSYQKSHHVTEAACLSVGAPQTETQSFPFGLTALLSMRSRAMDRHQLAFLALFPCRFLMKRPCPWSPIKSHLPQQSYECPKACQGRFPFFLLWRGLPVIVISTLVNQRKRVRRSSTSISKLPRTRVYLPAIYRPKREITTAFPANI